MKRITRALLFILVFSITACNPSSLNKVTKPAELRQFLLQLKDSSLVPVTSLTSSPDEEFTLWTENEAVTDIAVVRDAAGKENCYIAVNKLGLIRLNGIENGLPEYETFTKPAYLDSRTAAGIIKRGGDIYLHIYKDSVLGSFDTGELPVFALRLDNQQNSLKPIILPYAVQNPSWEAVSVVPQPDGNWAIAWKKTDKERRRTEFSYYIHNMQTMDDVEITEYEFLDSFNYKQLESASQHIKALVKRLNLPGSTVYHININSHDKPEGERYRIGNVNSLLVSGTGFKEIPAYKHGETWYALWNNTIHSVSDGNYDQIKLKKLPPGFVYENFVVMDSMLVIVWNEKDFIKTASTGLLLIEKSE